MYRPRLARTGTCTLVQGRTAMFTGRRVPNGNERARTHTYRGVPPGFPGVKAQTGTIGHVYTSPEAYSHVYRAYSPKRERTGTYPHVQGRTARFSWRKGPNGHERARAHSPRGLQPGFPGVQAQTDERARANSSKSVKPGFPGVQAQIGTNGHVHTRPGTYGLLFRAFWP